MPKPKEYPKCACIESDCEREHCHQHEFEAFISPTMGGFERCKLCGMERDREDCDGDLGVDY